MIDSGRSIDRRSATGVAYYEDLYQVTNYSIIECVFLADMRLYLEKIHLIKKPDILSFPRTEIVCTYQCSTVSGGYSGGGMGQTCDLTLISRTASGGMFDHFNRFCDLDFLQQLLKLPI